jgi:pyrroline-5-carboxylate reductase
MVKSEQPVSLLLLGAGRMGGAILAGLLKNGHDGKAISPQSITVVDAHLDAQNKARKLGVHVYSHLNEVKTTPDYMILAIKPQQFQLEYASLKAALSTRDLTLISVMAGVNTQNLQALGQKLTIIRAMPNTPCAISQGVTALYSANADAAAIAFVEAIFAPLGHYYWCDDEALMHAATAISGSGPAYGFMFLHALAQAAMAQGLSEKQARQSALYTLKGAVLLAENSIADFVELANQVTSPGGTTQAARAVLDAKLAALIAQAVQAAKDQSIALESAIKQ